jgi:hypothetical protein
VLREVEVGMRDCGGGSMEEEGDARLGKFVPTGEEILCDECAQTDDFKVKSA